MAGPTQQYNPFVKQAGLDLQEPHPIHRRIAYYDSDYEQTLVDLLDGVVAREDLDIGVSGTWEPVGTSALSSTNNIFALRNLTSNFHSYRILISNIRSTTSGTSFGLVFSSDGGTTFVTTGFHYAYNQRYFSSTAFPRFGTATASANQIDSRINLFTETNSRAVFEIYVYHHADANLYSKVDWVGMYGDNGSANTDWGFEISSGSHNQTVADDAIGLWTAAGEIDTGTVWVWGQRTPAS